VVLLVVAVTGVIAFGKTRKETVTLISNLKVNGTLVKKGTYDVSFDETTSELSIMKKGKEIAKVPARVEKRDDKAKSFEVRSTGDENELTGVTFSGSDQDIMITPSAAKN
jgi:hypothetical protein